MTAPWRKADIIMFFVRILLKFSIIIYKVVNVLQSKDSKGWKQKRIKTIIIIITFLPLVYIIPGPR